MIEKEKNIIISINRKFAEQDPTIDAAFMVRKLITDRNNLEQAVISPGQKG
jgi:hypothetical protein